MLEQFRAQLEGSNLISPEARILVGYSGGADSTCLLHLLHRAGFDIVAAHLHHGQRAEADLEMRLCEAFAAELNVPVLAGRADVPRMCRELKIGIEEAGREARYAFFRQAAFEMGCQYIATAHTLDDQAETILLRITRGTGLTGLAGIPAQRDNIVRPLLSFSRAETRAYCDENGLWTHDDPGNFDLAFSRVRIRQNVLPELRQINPQVDQALQRLGEVAGEEDRFLNGMAAGALERAINRLNGDLEFVSRDVEIAFDRSLLRHLPVVLMRRALRLSVEALSASLDHHQVTLAVDGIVGDENGSITCEHGAAVLEWSEQLVHVRILSPVSPFRYPLTHPGETDSDEFGWKFTSFEDNVSAEPMQRASFRVHIEPAAIKGPLYFRTTEPGDIMRPYGFDGRRKVSDLLSEAKLTAACRARLPVVCDLVGPIWIPGVCADERCRLVSGSNRARILTFEPNR